MSSHSRIRVLIVEPDLLMRESSLYLIGSSSKFVTVGACENTEAAAALVKITKPDIALLDPDSMPCEDFYKLKESYLQMSILVWSSNQSSEIVFNAFRCGANGYLLRSEPSHILLNGLEEVMKGGAPLSSKIARLVVTSFHVNTESPLTFRETQVLNLLATGKTYRQISEKLTIAKETSRKHISNIYQKLKVSSRSEAISVATNKRFILPSSRL